MEINERVDIQSKESGHVRLRAPFSSSASAAGVGAGAGTGTPVGTVGGAPARTLSPEGYWMFHTGSVLRTSGTPSVPGQDGWLALGQSKVQVWSCPSVQMESRMLYRT